MTEAPTGTEAVGCGEVADSAGILARQTRRESAARADARSLPIVPVRARGMTVEGADGRRYLDCRSGAGALALGHNHPVVLEAIRSALDAEAPSHVSDLATPVKDRFVETLFDTLPREFARDARIRFCGPTGADGIEAALSLVRAATGRRGVVAFAAADRDKAAGPLSAIDGYRSRGAAGASGARHAVEPEETSGPGSPYAATRLPYPGASHRPFGGGDEGAQLAVRRAEKALDALSGDDAPAAMILEVVHSEMAPAPDTWLRDIRRLTHACGIPLVVDETRTGLGRTGAFWAVEHSGIVPDVIVVSNAVGGSLPLAAVIHRGDLDGWSPDAHPGAFRGNQLAMAAGAATIRFIRENRLEAQAARTGAHLTAGLCRLMADQDAIADVRGRGLMIGVEIADPDAAPSPDGTRSPAPRLAVAVRDEALERGLIVGLGGRHATVVELLPPLTMTGEQADAVLSRLADAVAAAVGRDKGRRVRRVRRVRKTHKDHQALSGAPSGRSGATPSVAGTGAAPPDGMPPCG